jgi:DinB superfamily
MVIAPDTKDWTWVLRQACPDCGLDTRAVPRDRIGAMLRENAAQWADVLARPGIERRPSPQTWSALEYGCHVRDVFGVFDERLRLMLTETDPLFPNWNQDATAVEGRYDQQDPATVAAELQANAQVIADRFDRVDGQQWDRAGRRSDGAHFTVTSLGRYLVHDPVHHLYDVTGRRDS